MSPLLLAGDYVLCCRWPQHWFKPEQLIITRHPEYGDIVKRVSRRNSDGSLQLRGDNPASISSEQIGTISPASPTWRVIKLIRQPR